MPKKPTSKEKYEFKRMLEELGKREGRGTELISLYIPPDKNLDDVMRHMKDEYAQSANIKSKTTRKNVQSAIETIMQRLKIIHKPPENGLAMFCGTIPKKGRGEEMEVHLFEPPEPIPTYLYHCNAKFYLDPLQDMLIEKELYGLISMDRREASIGFLKGKNIETVQTFTSDVPGKHKKGGQSQRRFERLIEEAAHEFYKHVGNAANNIFSGKPDLQGILIGGPGPTKEEFVAGNYLKENIKQKIADVIDTGYAGEDGIPELVDRATDVLEELDITREKRLMQKFLQEIIKPEGVATYGEKEVRKALKMGLVGTLLLSEKLKKTRITIGCSDCKYIKSETTTKPEKYEEIEGDECPECGKGHLEIIERQDIIDELAKQAENIGADTEIISAETEEGAQLYTAFGGIAALLRFHPT